TVGAASSTSEPGTTTTSTTAALAPPVNPVELGFSLPATGYALGRDDGYVVYRADGSEVGRIAGARAPSRWYGSPSPGLVFQLGATVYRALPGSTEAVAAVDTLHTDPRFSATPGWTTSPEDPNCAVSPASARVLLCGEAPTATRGP